MRRQPRAFASLGGSKMEATLLPPSTSSISKPGRRMRPCGRSGKECWPNTRLARPVGRLHQVSPSRHLCSVPLNYYPLAGATKGPVLPYVFPEQPLETEAQRKAALARQAGGGAKKKKKKQASRAKADRKGKGKASGSEVDDNDPIAKLSVEQMRTEIKEFEELKQDLYNKVRPSFPLLVSFRRPTDGGSRR